MKTLLLIVILISSYSMQAQTKKLTVEPNHSTVGFNISIAGFTVVTGKFSDYEINMDWNSENLDSCWVSASIKVESINSGIADRDDHLRTADFFDVANYPTITFQSDSIIQVNYADFEAHGKLTMRGISKDFVLPFTIVKMEKNTIGIRSKATINRLDYNVGSDFKHTSMPDFLSENVEFVCYFWTKKRKSK